MSDIAGTISPNIILQPCHLRMRLYIWPVFTFSYKITGDGTYSSHSGKVYCAGMTMIPSSKSCLFENMDTTQNC